MHTVVQENSTNGGNTQVYITRNKDQPEGHGAAFLHATGINASLSLPTSHLYLLALYAHFGTRNAEYAKSPRHDTGSRVRSWDLLPFRNFADFADFRLDTGNTHKYILRSLWHSYPQCVNRVRQRIAIKEEKTRNEYNNWNNDHHFLVKMNLCEECNQEYTTFGWCQPYNSEHFKNNFDNWTNFKKLKRLEKVALVLYTFIYIAKWIDGLIGKWDIKNQQWTRLGLYDVVLKKYDNFVNLNEEFLNELHYFRYPFTLKQ
ncbi:hypothetical protein Glove_22g55 [Diversispora epigaea]|uniref:Uncharacterized protein n=1 Tax=Diversispora epigaea TaxID=1348612 RepID=A0A397JP06_9GLOM|nr:hypothetical protein Glove_22g55 [Diversispora epigaea]